MFRIGLVEEKEKKLVKATGRYSFVGAIEAGSQTSNAPPISDD